MEIQTKNFNLFGELRKNIEDFDTNGVYIIGKPSVRDSYKSLEDKGQDGGYFFSQKMTLEAVDLASASKYRKGPRDAEGKRKTYLNIVNFHGDVAINQVGVNTSNYAFEPVGDENAWPVFFMDKKFKEYSDENSYDDIIDEITEDYVKKGSAVTKKIKGGTERVPLRTLRNTQSAKSLEDAARNGGYVIIENEMSYNKMKKYPKWDIQDLSKSKTHKTFEQFSLVPRAIINKFKGIESTDSDWEEMVCAYQVLIPDLESFKSKIDAKDAKGKLVFIEEIQDIPGEFPLEEVHYRRIDGRWLGEGEIEKQLENQISRNLTANLRRRSLLWASKRIYQSMDDEVASNLLMEVKDGTVLKIKNNGNITPVNTQTQHLGDFTADDNSVKENSQQNSFSFESASGEAYTSGTPFRLGAILENAVSKYFKRKQDTLSNFLKRSFFNQLIPVFKENTRGKHQLRWAVGEDGYDLAFKGMVQLKKNEILKREWYKGNYVPDIWVEKKIEEELKKKEYLFWDIDEGFYDDIHANMRLNINEPIAADIESLTTIWDRLDRRGDPRADKVLKAIFAKRGKNLDYIMGSMKPSINQDNQIVNKGSEEPSSGQETLSDKAIA